MTQARFFLRQKVALLAFNLILLASAAGAADAYQEVGQLLRAGNPAAALARANQHLAISPRDPQMRFLKGVVQTEAGTTAEAIGTFTELTQEYPELAEPHNNLAVLHARAGDFDKARAALETAIRTNPRYATAHENLGDVYARLAAQAYARAIQLGASTAAVQPKLTLIGSLFAPPAQAPATGAP